MLTAPDNIEAGVCLEIRWRNRQELPLYVGSFTGTGGKKTGKARSDT